jgi:3-hexulose-6-phosphate synthase/6-phospho-3-hexuloisomerase
MLHPDKPGIAKKMEDWGIDVIIVHTGYDERHMVKGATPLDDLDSVRKAVKIPLQAVGGLSIEQAAGMAGKGAPLVVIGAPLAVADKEFKPGADSQALHDVIHDFVTKVKGS